MLAFLFVANWAGIHGALRVAATRRGAVRPFRVPGYPFVPGIALAGSLAFMVAAVLSDRTNSMLAVGLARDLVARLPADQTAQAPNALRCL